MITKNELKYIQSFVHKKHWAQESVFIVEGPKLVAETIQSEWAIKQIFCLESWANALNVSNLPVEIIDEASLAKISQLQQPNQVVALVQKRVECKPLPFEDQLTLVLDGIQDPGNFGTIIRTADWFDCKQIIISADTANLYNPKVIQSTMGSFLRVNICTMDIETLLANTALPVYGAMLSGESIYKTSFNKAGFLVIGNESKGIRPNLINFVKEAISIPRMGGAESLNAAVATGIILSHWSANR